jgi:hypothetical protein
VFIQDIHARIRTLLLQLGNPISLKTRDVLATMAQEVADDVGTLNLFGPLEPGEPARMMTAGPSAVRTCLLRLRDDLLRNDVPSAQKHARAALLELRSYGMVA